MRFLLSVTLALSTLTAAACTDSEPPAWQLTCESLDPVAARPDACKEACGADQLCPGADQSACELECRACTPDVAWCPTDSWSPQ